MALAVALPLCACASDDLDISEADIDQATQTGSVPNAQAQPDLVRDADEAIIRNAVSAADPEQAKIQPLAWANADTGSRGAISGLMEKQEDGLLCRKFTATRESFDGVALYSGDACKAEQGAWFMRSFKPL